MVTETAVILGGRRYFIFPTKDVVRGVQGVQVAQSFRGAKRFKLLPR